MLKSFANDQPPRPSLGGVRQIDHVAMCGSERSLYIRSLVPCHVHLARFCGVGNGGGGGGTAHTLGPCTTSDVAYTGPAHTSDSFIGGRRGGNKNIIMLACLDTNLGGGGWGWQGGRGGGRPLTPPVPARLPDHDIMPLGSS